MEIYTLSTFQRTAEFHEAFGHPVRVKPQVIPTKAEAILAFDLIAEELRELGEALFGESSTVSICHNFDAMAYRPNLTAVADAVGDLDVVVNGAGIRHGLDMERLSKAVSQSNMSKLGADGRPMYHPNGKIAKGPGFVEPDLSWVEG